jgi:ATP synthase protein I
VKINSGLSGIKKLLTAQILGCLLASVSILLVSGQQQAVSVLLGGVTAILPSMLFVKKLFQHQGAQSARLIVKSFYVAEFLKLLVSIVLFTLVFVFYEAVPQTFFLTYIAVLLTHWFAPLVIDRKLTGPKSE